MEKVRGKIFAAFFANESSFILEYANIEMLNLQMKLTHTP